MADNAGFDTLLEHWFPLTYALNSINRGAGLPDLYPFVLSPPALEKLRFVHDIVCRRESRGQNTSSANEGMLQEVV